MKKVDIYFQLLFGNGGTEKVSRLLFEYLINNKDINVIPFYTKNSIGNNINCFESYKKYNPEFITNINQFNKKVKLIQIFSDGSDNNPAILGIKQQTTFKIIINDVDGRLMQYNNAFHITFPSISCSQNYKSKGRLNYSVIYNPIKFNIHNEHYRSELNIENKFVFGRISRPDNSIYTYINLESYKLIEDESTMFIYMSAPPQAYEDAKRLNIKNIIFLNESLNEFDIIKFYNTIDVLAHTNKLGESFGNTIAESMYFSKPVISHIGYNQSWSQAQPELLGELSSELFIDNLDNIIDKYKDLMLKLKNDKLFYNKCSIYLKERSNEFNLDAIGNKYFNIYKTLI